METAEENEYPGVAAVGAGPPTSAFRDRVASAASVARERRARLLTSLVSGLGGVTALGVVVAAMLLGVAGVGALAVLALGGAMALAMRHEREVTARPMLAGLMGAELRSRHVGIMEETVQAMTMRKQMELARQLKAEWERLEVESGLLSAELVADREIGTHRAELIGLEPAAFEQQ